MQVSATNAKPGDQGNASVVFLSVDSTDRALQYVGVRPSLVGLPGDARPRLVAIYVCD